MDKQISSSVPNAMHIRGIKINIKDLDNFEPELNKPYVPTKLTNYEVGVHGEKNIIIPSFGTTSAIFARHFNTLRQLRRRLDLLKQQYYSQMDQEKCWE